MSKALPKTPPAPTPEPTPVPTPEPTQPPAPQTASYLVGACPVLHDGQRYGPGWQIELTPAQAERLARHVTPLPAAAPGQPTTF